MFVKRNKTKTKAEVTKQRTHKKKKKSHNQPQYRRKQYVKTDAVYNNREAEEQIESLTINCINMTQRDEAFVLMNIKLPNRNGIHMLRLKIDTGAKGNTLPVSTCAEPRSYILHIPDGSSKRQNRVQIRAAETSSHKQVHLDHHTASLQKGLPNTSNISHQRTIKQPTCNTTRSGSEIHWPKRYKINKQEI